jgi:hypothetical protein
VAEVPRVVARLLERAQDERGERLLAAAALARVRHDALADLARQAGGLARAQVVGDGRRRHAELLQLRQQEPDRLRVGALVHAVERGLVPRREELRDALVREDHQLLDQPVRLRLVLEPRALDAAAAVEREGDLGALDAERAAGEAAVADLARVLVGELQRLADLGRRRLLAAGEDALGLAVGETRVAADHRAVEDGLVTARRELDGHGQSLDVRAQRAEVVGELVRQHRRDLGGHVRREAAVGGAAVERRAGGHEVRDVGDVHPGAHAGVLASDRDRVVEVLRGLRVDRERRQVAQVGAPLDRRLGRVVRLVALAQALLDEQRLEHVLDLGRRAEHAVDGGPPPHAYGDEVAFARVAERLAVDDDGHAGLEVRLADDELPAPRELDDD